MAHIIRSRYGNPPPPGTGGIDCSGDSLTRQEFAKESDINRIMKRYERTGGMPIPQAVPFYGDVSVVDDYLQAQLLVQAARETFAALPANLRDRFQNDPSRYLQFVGDPANLPAMAELGMLTPEARARLQAEKVTTTTLPTTPAVTP